MNCSVCLGLKPIYAKKMCVSCYQKYRYALKSKSPDYYERKREMFKEYYKKFKNIILEKQRLWRNENKTLSRSRVRESMRNIRNKARAEGLGYNDVYLLSNNRRVVYERDFYRCADCHITNAEHLEKFNQILPIHHIDMKGHSKKKLDKNNDISNLITLCNDCHRGEHNKLKFNHGRTSISQF